MAGETTPLDVSAAGRLGGERTRLRYGPEHFRRIGRLGGESLSTDRAHMQEIGRRGGEAVSQDRAHMSRIGTRGSGIVKERYGPEYYSTIGRLGAERRWAKARKEAGSE